jgi:hypothetical protein
VLDRTLRVLLTGRPVGGAERVEVTSVDDSSRRTRRNLPSQDAARAAALRGEM